MASSYSLRRFRSIIFIASSILVPRSHKRSVSSYHSSLFNASPLNGWGKHRIYGHQKDWSPSKYCSTRKKRTSTNFVTTVDPSLTGLKRKRSMKGVSPVAKLSQDMVRLCGHETIIVPGERLHLALRRRWFPMEPEAISTSGWIVPPLEMNQDLNSVSMVDVLVLAYEQSVECSGYRYNFKIEQIMV